MNLLQVWPLVEAFIIIAVFAFVLLRIWRTMKARAKNPKPPPISLSARIGAGLLYALRLFGFLAATLVAVILFVMIERNILAVITETVPRPSEVTVPANLGFGVEEVIFESEDGLTIAGWHVPSQNGATIILLHGYGGNRTGTLWYARQLIPAGYGVLMYDERASGESEGTYRSYGWEDTRDTSGAIQFLFEKAGADEKIGILGCSTGADIALRSAAYFPELGAVWADGASSIRAQDLPSPTNPLIALLVAGNYTLDWMYTVKLDIEPPEPLIYIIDDIAPRPVILVGGGTPRPLFGSEAEMYTLRFAELAGPNAEAWIIPEATHCNGPRLRPEEYAARMLAFFDDAFELK